MAENYLNCRSQGPQDAFVPSLFASFIAHLLVFGIWNAAPPSPRYAVAQAPTSMEIVLVEAPPVSDRSSGPNDNFSIQDSRTEDKVVPDLSDVMTVSDPSRKAHAAVAPVEKPYNRILPGAATQARPSGVLNPAPVYPALARRQGWEGTVIVRALVQADGLPGQVVVEKSSGHKILDNAASEAIRRWKFNPTAQGPRAQGSWVEVPVRFALVDE